MDELPVSFQLLALDGGGVRGLFSAAILANLERDLGITATQHFDLLCGTSTGGIIALGLALGKSPQELVEFYLEFSKVIFRPRWPNVPWVELVRHVRGAKYDNAALIDVLKKAFGDARMEDCQIPVVIPAFNLDNDSVRLFKSPHHSRLTRDGRIPVWQVALATSAAPTFLPASIHTEHQRLVDGGLWANNPIIVGIAEAVSLLDVPLHAIQALNLGTMSQVNKRSDSLDRGGLWAWKQDATDVMLRAQSCGAFGLAQHLIGHQRVFRIDTLVPPKVLSLDRLDARQLRSLAASESQKFAPQFTQHFQEHHATTRRPTQGWRSV